MRLTATLFAVLLATALVSTNAEAGRRHHHHHHHARCVAPDARTVNNLAIVAWASLFAGVTFAIPATSAADAAAKQVLACKRARA